MTDYIENGFNTVISASFEFSTNDSLVVRSTGAIVLPGGLSYLGVAADATGIYILAHGLIEVASFELGAQSNLNIGVTGSLTANGQFGSNNIAVGGSLGHSVVDNRGQITALHFTGLTMSGGHNQVVNGGTITGEYFAVVLGQDFSGSDTLNNWGTIQSTVYQALGMIGGQGQVRNTGTISSVTGAAVFASGEFDGTTSSATTQKVANSGLLVSQDHFGIVVMMSDAGSTFILRNSGSVRGGAGSFSGNNEVDLIFNSARMEGAVSLAAGNDRLNTNGGKIFGNVYLGDGNDTFLGFGAIVKGCVFGGDGADVYWTDRAYLDICEAPSLGEIDIVRAAVSFRLTEEIEQLKLLGTADFKGYGNSGDNTVTGNTGNNRLAGRAGADTLKGGLGDDQILGGADGDRLNGDTGNDMLNGNQDADALFGGSGNDMLDGGEGKDRLTGGDGADSFVFTALSHAGATLTTADIILDFTQGEDVITLTAIDANHTNSGSNDAFTFIGGALFSNVAGQLRFDQNGGNTYVWLDTDGNGTAEAIIRLNGLFTLNASDFVL